MSFVLDSSVTLAWAFDDERTPYTMAIRSLLATREAIVPDFWLIEVANVLRTAERKGRLDSDESALFVDILSRLPIRPEGSLSWAPIMEAKRLAVHHKLTVYDAVYLELATRRGLPLATTDAELLRAATAAGVAVV